MYSYLLDTTLAQAYGVTRGRKLRVDTTVVETNIHYPTDSSLLGDGTRVLTRTMKKIEQKAGGLKRKVRDRMRSVRKRVLAIALSTRYLGAEGEARRKKQYGELLSLTRKTVNQAQRILEEVKEGPRLRRIPLRSLVKSLATMMQRVQQVVKQTKLRIFAGVTKSQEKIVSVFESHTEIIRKGKASKPTEFGKLVKIQESENQIISHFEVFAERPSDRQLLVPSIEVQQRRFGRIPAWVAADAGFHSQQNEKAARAMGVRWFSVPNQKTKSAERKRLYRQRWFRRGQRWRTGCEGRISALKRRHGMRRCLYRGFHGMQRWWCYWRGCGCRRPLRLSPLHRRQSAKPARLIPATSPFLTSQDAMSGCRSTASWICFLSSPAGAWPTSVPDRDGSRCVPLTDSPAPARFMLWTSTPKEFDTLNS